MGTKGRTLVETGRPQPFHRNTRVTIARPSSTPRILPGMIPSLTLGCTRLSGSEAPQAVNLTRREKFASSPR